MLRWQPCPFHVLTQENLSFGPATPRAHSSPGSLNTVHHCLTYQENEESSLDLAWKTTHLRTTY